MSSGAPIEVEKWKEIARFPAYSVSSFGRVRRDAPVHGGRGSVRIPQGFLAQRSLPLGHMQVTLCMSNKPKTFLVHRLVAEAFLPPPRPGQDCVLHRDDTPANNRASNLFWGTRIDNTNDMVAKDRQAKGDRVKSCKLDISAVQEIRRRASAGERQWRIAADFGIEQTNVSMIVNRLTWKHVA